MAASLTPLLAALPPAARRAGLAATLLAATLLATSAAPAGAQAAVVGRVITDSSGAPVAGAEVAVVTLGRSARSDAVGRFRLDLPAGAHTVVVRRIGFRQLALPVELGAGDSLEVDVALSATVQTLTAVAVEGEANRGRIAAFEERRASGFGAFLGRDDLAEREHSRLSDVLRSHPGIRLVPLFSGGHAVANGRFSGSIEPMRPQECYMAIYLDGVRIYSPGDADPTAHPNDKGKGPDIDRYMVNGIEALEVYRGPAETPPEFLGSNAACGTVVIWTRR